VTSVWIMAGGRNRPYGAAASDKFCGGRCAPVRREGTASPAGFLRHISRQRVARLTQQEAAGGQQGQENELTGLLHSKTNRFFCTTTLPGRLACRLVRCFEQKVILEPRTGISVPDASHLKRETAANQYS
jgi:hypothetical protein